MVSPGTKLGGRYRLDERIAGGGMGDVWRGTDEVLGRTVAIKILLPALLEEAGFAERFRGEARTMATINHPGVVDVYDYGSEGGTAFLVMEYVEGDALSRTLSRVGRLTPGRTMALIAQAADALHAAHEKGIVHRDVKPGNLLVRPNGTLVLTDFGIARSAMVGQLTAAGSVLGTASYISPEQAAGGVASPLSDVYALGVVAYQCLAGHRPFEGDNPVEIAMRHVRDMPPPLPADTPPVVRQFVERAMAKDPAARYPTAAAMAQVARRAAASMATVGGAPAPATGPMTPTSGGPSGPISGPPSGPLTRPPAGSPVGPPVPGAPVSPLPPGGTRVMPGGMYPPGGPVSPPQRPGQFARGAAAVPAAGPATDYTFAEPVRPGSPPGGRGPGGGQGTGPGPGGPGRGAAGPGNAAGGGKNVALWAAMAVIIILLFCVGGGWLLRNRSDNSSATAPPPSAAPVTTGPTAAQKGNKPKPTPTTGGATPKSHILVCEEAQGKNAQAVRKSLEENNYTVKVITDQPGGHKGTVAAMSPCGRQPEGTEVTLRVFTGGDATNPDPGNSCNPFDPNGLASCPPQR
jgi:eukaryotic-like serine/threonine-protein kinase